MSNQKISNKKKRVVLLVAVIVVVAAITAGFTNMIPLFASQTHENNLQNPDSQTPSTEHGGDVEVGKGLRTKDNTGCVNPPNGPKIC